MRTTWLAGILILGIAGVGAFLSRERWLPVVTGKPAPSAVSAPASDAHDHDHGHDHDHDHDHSHEGESSNAQVLKLGPEAQRNLGLVAKPVEKQTYWRTILIPGAIVDRPGLSDRGVTSPAVGVVTQIHAFPGDAVRAGQRLFTIRLFSEYLQNTQSELFKSTGEIALVKEQLARLDEAAKTGAIPDARLIELNNQVRRQNTLLLAYRQDLLTRGLSPTQIEEVAKGQFVSTIEIVAPPVVVTLANGAAPVEPAGEGEPVFELQDLSVELGQQVQAGQLLAKLSNHRSLYVAGYAFKPEAPYLEKAAQERRPIDIEFAEDDDASWSKPQQRFEIRHLANAINPETRTFEFFIPLVNQSRGYERNGETFTVWRYRPGQRARLHVPVEEFRDVFVVPAAAVAHEGPETFVFQQNGDVFVRQAVRVLYEDRRHAVLEPDGAVKKGMLLAQSAAATLNRVLKAQSAGGETAGFHVHADGTVHGAH
jgi:membrane fusion protein, heavy metal efflux system